MIPRHRHLGPLAHRRVAVGLTQDELAARLGVTRNHVSMVERGHRPVSAGLAPRWADALGVAETWLRDPTAPRTDPDAIAIAIRTVLTADDLATFDRIRDADGLAELDDFERAIGAITRLIDAATTPTTKE